MHALCYLIPPHNYSFAPLHIQDKLVKESKQLLCAKPEMGLEAQGEAFDTGIFKKVSEAHAFHCH